MSKPKEAINRVYSMGLNESGQLGVGVFGKSLHSPTPVPFFDHHKLTLLVAGGSHTVAVTDNHRLFTWGSGDRGELGLARQLRAKALPHPLALAPNSDPPAASAPNSLPLRIKYIAAGLNNTFVVTECGKCYGWGWNYLAELSLGHSNLIDAPFRCPFLDSSIKVRGVAAGANHTLFVIADGRLLAAGHGGYGELGLGDNSIRTTPHYLPFFDGKSGGRRVRFVSAGGNHSMAYAEDNKLYSWGSNHCGELGLGPSCSAASYSTPQCVAFFASSRVKLLSTGHNHSLALTDRGKLYSWGEASDGQLGLGEIAAMEATAEAEPGEFHQSTPHEITFFQNYRVKMIYAAFFHSFVVTDDGKLFAFGNNSAGQLGIGSTDKQYSPVEVPFFRKMNIRLITAGYCHTVVATGLATPLATQDSLLALQADLKHLRETGAFSNVSLQIRGQSYALHTEILRARCPALLDPSVLQTLNLKDLSNLCIERTLDYVYSDLVEDEVEGWEGRELVEAFLTAQILALPQFQRLLQNEIQARTTCANVLDLVDLCYYYETKDLQAFAFDYACERDLHDEFGEGGLVPTAAVYFKDKAHGHAVASELLNYRADFNRSSDRSTPGSSPRQFSLYAPVEVISKLPIDLEQLYLARSADSCDFRILIHPTPPNSTPSTIYVHRAILASRSDYFHACIGSSFRESQTGVLELPSEANGGCPLSAVESLIYYLYTAQVYQFKEASDCLSILQHASLFCITPETDLRRDHSLLLEHCEKSSVKALNRSNCLKILQSANEIGSAPLKNRVLDYVVDQYFDLPETDLLDLPQKLLLQIFGRVLRKSMTVGVAAAAATPQHS